ncbi:MAG TPA: hypothetical protein VM659_12830 [Dongiaceae bacterium]|nr:hypothetical protein [Dongiaceae bacterium]
MPADFIRLPGYHDAELIGVSVDRDARVAQLRFKRADRPAATVTLHGLQDFRIVDLIPQNVVSRLMIHTETAFLEDEIRTAITWARNLSDTQLVPDERQLQEVIEKVRRGTLSVLILEPSYGAELVASFDSLTEDEG